MGSAEHLCGANLRCLKVPAIDLVADDDPKLTVNIVVAEGHMHRSIPRLLMKFDGMQAKGLAPLEMKVVQLLPAFAHPPEPGIALEPNAVVPT